MEYVGTRRRKRSPEMLRYPVPDARRARLFAEDEVDGQNQAEESCEVVPAQRVGAHEHQGEDREHRQRDDLLNDLELPDRIGAAEFGASQAVCRDLEAILEQGDEPAHQDNGQEPETLEMRLEGDMAVPRKGHEGVRDDEQYDSGESAVHGIQRV